MTVFAFLWPDLCAVVGRRDAGVGPLCSFFQQPCQIKAPLRFCLPPPPDPQLFFGIALILIALSALPFRQLLRLYGFD